MSKSNTTIFNKIVDQKYVWFVDTSQRHMPTIKLVVTDVNTAKKEITVTVPENIIDGIVGYDASKFFEGEDKIKLDKKGKICILKSCYNKKRKSDLTNMFTNLDDVRAFRGDIYDQTVRDRIRDIEELHILKNAEFFE